MFFLPRIWRTTTSLLIVAVWSWMAVAGTLSWAECEHHFGQLAKSHAAQHQAHAAEKASIAPETLPLCGEHAAPSPTASPAAIASGSTQQTSAEHSDTNPSHQCDCGDLSCVMAQGVAGSAPATTINIVQVWQRVPAISWTTSTRSPFLHARAVLPDHTAPPA